MTLDFRFRARMRFSGSQCSPAPAPRGCGGQTQTSQAAFAAGAVFGYMYGQGCFGQQSSQGQFGAGYGAYGAMGGTQYGGYGSYGSDATLPGYGSGGIGRIGGGLSFGGTGGIGSGSGFGSGIGSLGGGISPFGQQSFQQGNFVGLFLAMLQQAIGQSGAGNGGLNFGGGSNFGNGGLNFGGGNNFGSGNNIGNILQNLLQQQNNFGGQGNCCPPGNTVNNIQNIIQIIIAALQSNSSSSSTGSNRPGSPNSGVQSQRLNDLDDAIDRPNNVTAGNVREAARVIGRAGDKDAMLDLIKAFVNGKRDANKQIDCPKKALKEFIKTLLKNAKPGEREQVLRAIEQLVRKIVDADNGGVADISSAGGGLDAGRRNNQLANQIVSHYL